MTATLYQPVVLFGITYGILIAFLLRGVIRSSRLVSGSGGRSVILGGVLLWLLSLLIEFYVFLQLDGESDLSDTVVIIAATLFTLGTLIVVLGYYETARVAADAAERPLLTTISHSRHFTLLGWGCLMLLLNLPLFFADMSRSNYDWTSSVQNMFRAGAVFLIFRGEREFRARVSRGRRAVAAAEEVLPAYLQRDDMILVLGYLDLFNSLLSAVVEVGDSGHFDRLASSLLDETLFRRSDNRLLVSPQLADWLEGDEARLISLGKKLGVACGAAADLLGRLTSPDLAQEHFSDAFRLTQSRFGRPLVFFQLLAYLPGGSLDQAKINLLTRSELEQAYLRLREMDQVKSEFIDLASHELKAPLAPIKTTIDLFLAGAYGEMDDKQEDKMQRLQRSVKRLHSTISGILDLTHLESPRLRLVEIDLPVLALKCWQTVGGPSSELEFKIFGTGTIEGDVVLVEKVFNNLYSNALKFCETGVVSTTVVVEEAGVEVTVADEGPGIPDHHREHIFDRFYQVEVGTRRDEGSGLGLAIVLQIMAHHGGAVTYTSGDPGAQFHLVFPRRADTVDIQSDVEADLS